MPAPHRAERVGDEILRRVTELIQTELADPRVSFMSSITRVEMSSDLRYAKLYISVMGTSDEQKDTITALRHAAGYLRHELGSDLRLRHIPELQFMLDHSIEEGDRVLRVIREVEEHERERESQVDG